MAHLAERRRALAGDRRDTPSDRAARERTGPRGSSSPKRGSTPACSWSAPSAPARPRAACTRSPSSFSPWRADDPRKCAGALVLEVKGDFCHQVRSILDDAGRGGDYLEIGLGGSWQWNPLDDPLLDSYSTRLRRGIAHQPTLRQEQGTVLAAGVHEPRAVDHRTAPAPAGRLGHAAGHLPLHRGRGTPWTEDRRSAGSSRTGSARSARSSRRRT